MYLLASGLPNDHWEEALTACLIGLRFFWQRVLGMAPFTVICGMAPRLPVESFAKFDMETFKYDETVPEQYVDELVWWLTMVHKELVDKLQVSDEANKVAYDRSHVMIGEFVEGQLVMVKNR